MSGATIEQCLNDAVLLAIRKAGAKASSKELLEMTVTLRHIDEAFTRHLLGGVATGHMNESDRLLAAIHEAGHAVIRLDSGIEVFKVSVTPYTSGAGGLTQSDIESTAYLTQDDLKARIRFILGGLAAEEVVTGVHTTGVANDLIKASELALQCVTCFGTDSLLNEASLRDSLGFRGISDATLVKAELLLQDEAKNARDVCVKHREFFNSLVKRLLAETTILNLLPTDLCDTTEPK